MLFAMMSLLNVKSFAQEKNFIGISNVNMSRSGRAELTLFMENRSEIVAVEFVLQLPKGFTVNPLSSKVSFRAKEHKVTVKELGNGKYKFVLFSMNNCVIQGVSGNFLTAEISSDNTVSDNNEYVMSISDAIMCDKDGNNVVDETLSGSVFIKNLPNLHVVSLECSAPVATRPLQVEWTVRNDGLGSTGDAKWKDYVWLIPNIAGGTSMLGSQLLATVDNISALGPGESYDNSINVILDERIFGNYDLLVTSDMYNVNDVDFSGNNGEAPIPYLPDEADYGFFYGMTNVSLVEVEESNEYGGKSDNFFYKRVTVEVPPLPDLSVMSVVAVVDNSESFEGESRLPSPIQSAGLASSKTFYSGKKVKVTATIENKGNMDVAETNIRNVLYISSTSDGSGLTYKIAVNSTKLSLAAGEKKNINFSAYIPYEWFGDTYFIVQTDVDGAVYEKANTVNNLGAGKKINVLLTPGADFVPNKIKVPEKLLSGMPLSIEYSVSNDAPGDPFVDNWTDYIYLSKEGRGLNDEAVLLGKIARKGYYARQTSTTSGDTEYDYVGDEYNQKIDLASNKIKEGDYYVYIVVDADNNVLEYEGEENNVLRSGKISISNPDLSVSLVSIQDTVVAGETMPVAWKLKNQGNVEIKNTTVSDAFFVVLGNGDTVSLGTTTNKVSILPGKEKNLKHNLKVPDEAKFSGKRQLFVITNYKKAFAEADYGNNVSNFLDTEFLFRPKMVNGNDLRLLNIDCEDSAVPGSLFEVSAEVYNSGNKILNENITFDVYLSRKNGGNDIKCEKRLTTNVIGDFAPGDTRNYIELVAIPEDIIGGEYYMKVVVNGDRTIQENSYSNNESSKRIFINGNIPDLRVEFVDLPSEMVTSKEYVLSWKVMNVGYGSRKNILNKVFLKKGSNKELMLSKNIESLNNGDSVTIRENLVIDDIFCGEYEIIVQVDCLEDDYEVSLADNTYSSELMIIQGLLPDLYVDSISYSGEWIGGSVVNLTATVRNTGECNTRKNMWSDAFYLSDSYTLDKSKAIKLSSKTRQGVLKKDDGYKMETQVRLPLELNGHYVLFAAADVTDAMVERQEYNNMAYSVVHIEDLASRAGDIEVAHLEVPSHIIAGKDFAMEYRLCNKGQYRVSGLVRDVIYLSYDNIFGADDIMVGVVNGEIDIEPGSAVNREVTGLITNVPEGDYYFIIRTNSAHSIAETDYDNNYYIQTTTSNINFARIDYDSPVKFSTSGLYKLEIHEDYVGATINVKLNIPEDQFAGLYVSYENVPTTASNDYSSCSYEVREQYVLIPNAKKGTYYILAQDNSFYKKNVHEFSLNNVDAVANAPEMELSCKIVDFGAIRIFPIIGGREGWITVKIDGALFDSIMDARLRYNGKILFSERMTFNNSTQVVANFNLNTAETGVYDLILELPNGTESVMKNCFEVVPGKSVELAMELNVPDGVRSGVATPVSVTYVNGGNTDIVVKELKLVSNGAVFSRTVDGLKEMKKELSIKPVDTVDGDYVIIPPGKQNVINCYMKLVDQLTSISIYIVR